MKKFKLFALAVMAMLSTNAFAQLASEGFKMSVVDGLKVEIIGLAEDYAFATDGVVTIPATLKNTAGDDFQVIGIADGAFTEGSLDEDLRLKVKGLKIAASVTYIGEDAFADLGNLASVTFGTESAASKLKYIETGAFAKDPCLKTISFANCPDLKYFTADGTDASADATPFVNGANPTNATLTSIVLNEATAYIGTALANVTKLATVNIKDTKIRTLVPGALENNEALKTLELPSKKFYSEETGEELGSTAVTLEAGALADTKIETLIINGNVEAGGIEALGIETLTSVTIKGDVETGGILEDAFLDNTKLATVTFEGVLESEAVLGGAFKGAGSAAAVVNKHRMTVNAKNKDNDADAFQADAFIVAGGDADDVPADADATVVDKKNVLLLTHASIAVAPVPYRVDWTAAPAGAQKLPVESNDETTFYAKFTADGNAAFSRDNGNVTVYSAYTDGENIYMDPLYSKDGKIIVEDGESVIVKAKGNSVQKAEDGTMFVEYEGSLEDNTMRYYEDPDNAGDYIIMNEIEQNDKITNQDLNKLAADYTTAVHDGNTYATYAVAKISTNGLKWQAISNEGTFYVKNAFYLIAKKSASGVRVVWLDEENATAIQSFKAKVEAGQIYNLRGQKVNASYKGIVIKDGKKYIQK